MTVRPGRDPVPPAEQAWLDRVFALLDLHPVTPAERDWRVAAALAEVRAIDLSERQYLRLVNRAAGTSPELDEAVRLLGLYVERFRDTGRRMPRPGPGGVTV